MFEQHSLVRPPPSNSSCQQTCHNPLHRVLTPIRALPHRATGDTPLSPPERHRTSHPHVVGSVWEKSDQTTAAASVWVSRWCSIARSSGPLAPRLTGTRPPFLADRYRRGRAVVLPPKPSNRCQSIAQAFQMSIGPLVPSTSPLGGWRSGRVPALPLWSAQAWPGTFPWRR